MPIIEPRIAAGPDDWNWREPNVFEHNVVAWNWGNAFDVDGGEKCGGRWQVTGPASGDTIVAAKLIVVARAGRTDDIEILIDGVAADDPAAPTSKVEADGLARTTANVTQSWTQNTSAGQTYETADVTAVVQEIIDRPGWASGNHMILVVRDNSSTGGAFQQIKTYNESTTEAPVLHIEYTEGAGGEPPQFARPDADVAAGNWTPSTGSDLHAMLSDEEPNDATFIESTGTPTNDTARIRLSSLGVPEVRTDHVLRLRLRRKPD